MASENWGVIFGSILIFSAIIWFFLLAFRHGHKPKHQGRVRYQDEEEMETIDVYVVERGKGQGAQPISMPENPWLAKLACLKWFNDWQWYYGYNKVARARAQKALDLLIQGDVEEAMESTEREEMEQDDEQVIESTIKVIPEPEEEPSEQSSTTTPQWSLSALKDNGQWAHYHTYAWGMLAYLYHHLPESGTIHRDNNKRENGYVGGKVISNIQWDQFIGSSDPSSQKGQGLLRRAGLIREEEREGRKVSVFTHKDVGQAIDKLIQYTIKEQQGERDEEEKGEDTIAPTRPDSSLPLPNYQWQEYR